MKYKPRLIWSGLVVGGLLILLLLAFKGFLANPLLWESRLALLPFFIGLFLVANPIWGMYIRINNLELSRSDFFFLRDRMAIKDIRSVVYQNSFVVGGQNKTVSVFDANGKKVFMESMPFGKDMQRDLIRNLIQLNPAIRLNGEAEELIHESN